jgi:hypothetical protein
MEWLNYNAGAIQALCTIVLVLFTGLLFWVTRTYALAAQRQAEESGRQVAETKEQRFDQHRPALHPVGNLALTESRLVNWYEASLDLPIQNVGTGVALVVCGILFPPEGAGRPGLLPQRYSAWRESAVLPGQGVRSIRFLQGVTKTNGDETIGNYRLSAPEAPTHEKLMFGLQYNILARLTLTYQDIFMRKHAAMFDYIDIYGWQCVALLPDIPRDLDEIEHGLNASIYRAVLEGRSAHFANPRAYFSRLLRR